MIVYLAFLSGKSFFSKIASAESELSALISKSTNEEWKSAAESGVTGSKCHVSKVMKIRITVCLLRTAKYRFSVNIRHHIFFTKLKFSTRLTFSTKLNFCRAKCPKLVAANFSKKSNLSTKSLSTKSVYHCIHNHMFFYQVTKRSVGSGRKPWSGTSSWNPRRLSRIGKKWSMTSGRRQGAPSSIQVCSIILYFKRLPKGVDFILKENARKGVIY